ncbi:hypothetical protein HWC35_gp090 [Vibrio phage USC-1]|uniref:Capsid and scaffold protein n=2 Tax=Aphroditevirus USC1 TaxID=2846605 RepID=A0A514A2H2_9CAUD|nr:hypothetical protein HWC35_gp090 [Vibrio phage USC-1]QCW23244.1 hypothetical protein [Vibrio phage 5 TSL-2019]QDH47484.1 hypothetical protein [Vibrio phage USC-1]
MIPFASLGATMLANLTGEGAGVLAGEIAGKATDGGIAAIGTNKGNSLVREAQKTMIRPMVVVEQSIIHQDYASDLMTIIQLRDIQATLTHLRLQGSVGGVQISKYIEPIRPVRGMGRSLGSFGGLESFGGTNIVKPVDGMEAVDTPDGVKVDSKSAQSVLSEYAPLALGRTIEAVITSNGETVSFPLTFRQIPVPMSTKDLERVFDHAKGEDSWQTRFDKLEVGMITPPELLTGRDIIKEKFRIRLDDIKANSRYISDSIKNQRNHVKKAATSGEMSLNNMANAFVITDTAARQIEMLTGKRFSVFSQRETLWTGLRANTIVICNEARGLFTFYTWGSKDAETYTRNDLKQKAAKESSVGSLTDIMKLLNGGM